MKITRKIQLDLLTEEGNLSSLQAKAAVLKTQIESGRGELNALNDTEMQLAQLERDLETQKSNYRKYSDSLEQARIDQALEMEKISNISIVQPASYPVKPIRPKKLLNLALGLFLGIFGGLGLAFFTEYQDHSFKKPEDVDKPFESPGAGDPPRTSFTAETDRGPSIEQKRRAGGDSCALPFGSDWIRQCVPRAVASFRRGDSGRPLRRRPGRLPLGRRREHSRGAFRPAKRPAKRGACSRRGCQFPSCPSQHLSFRTKLSPGLTDFTSNGRPSLSCIQSTEIENLDILSAGDGKPELSASGLKALAAALPALKREYSHIIFDLPAVQEHSPAMQIAGLMDGVILVVEAEKHTLGGGGQG